MAHRLLAHGATDRATVRVLSMTTHKMDDIRDDQNGSTSVAKRLKPTLQSLGKL